MESNIPKFIPSETDFGEVLFCFIKNQMLKDPSVKMFSENFACDFVAFVDSLQLNNRKNHRLKMVFKMLELEYNK